VYLERSSAPRRKNLNAPCKKSVSIFRDTDTSIFIYLLEFRFISRSCTFSCLGEPPKMVTVIYWFRLLVFVSVVPVPVCVVPPDVVDFLACQRPRICIIPTTFKCVFLAAPFPSGFLLALHLRCCGSGLGSNCEGSRSPVGSRVLSRSHLFVC
jgi:hypothetical protein